MQPGPELGARCRGDQHADGNADPEHEQPSVAERPTGAVPGLDAEPGAADADLGGEEEQPGEHACRVPPPGRSVLGEQRVDELVGVEVDQVVGRLAQADELDRDARASDWMASTMPPLAEPSSLVSTTPVTSTASVNCWACTRPFCPVVASRTSSTSVTLPGLTVGDPPHLAQLLHEVDLGVQPTGGVGEHEVGALARRRAARRRR